MSAPAKQPLDAHEAAMRFRHSVTLHEAEARLMLIAGGVASRKTFRRVDAQAIRVELARLRAASVALSEAAAGGES